MKAIIVSLILSQSAFAADSDSQPLKLVVRAGQATKRVARVNGDASGQPDCPAEISPESLGMGGPPTLEYKPDFNAKARPPITGPTKEIEDEYKRKFKVSVLTPEQACAAQKQLVDAKSSEFKLGYRDALANGCEARAHLTGSFLQSSKIESGKLWFTGDLNPIIDGKRNVVRWGNFHVSDFVMVTATPGKEPERWVLDPLIPMPNGCQPKGQSSPLAESEYRKWLSTSPSGVDAQVSNRFVYRNGDRPNKRDYYWGDDLTLAGNMLKSIRTDLRDNKINGVSTDTRTPNY